MGRRLEQRLPRLAETRQTECLCTISSTPVSTIPETTISPPLSPILPRTSRNLPPSAFPPPLIQVRDFIHTSLYHPTDGHFTPSLSTHSPNFPPTPSTPPTFPSFPPQVRDFIHTSLYHPTDGYFTSNAAAVGSIPHPISFRQLAGRREWMALQQSLYASADTSWFTPSELFQPWYGYAVADFILSSHSPTKPLKSALRAETPPASQESGQQPSAAQRSREPDGGCGTEPSPHARADTRAASAHAEERPGLGPRRRGDRWSPQYGRESAPHSPGPASPPPRTCAQHDRGLDQAGCHSRLALRPSASPAVPRNQPNVDAGGTARGDPNSSNDQATPSPASPEIAKENVARGIALAVSAGLHDHEGMGGEGSEDVQENAYPPPRADSARDAQEKGGEERAAVEGAAEASTRAPAAADRPGGSTQHEQAPTNTLARRGIAGRATRGIRVGRGSRRGRRSIERGRRGGGARGSNRRRSGASGYARNVERLMRNGAEGDVEPLSEEAEEVAENEESEEGDPAFNPESEGMLEAEAEEDEEELELLREAELPNQQARGEPANRTSSNPPDAQT
ncbi:unnamed protein product [Closterium sp. NIES-65]|nr:unnamed protein product [Closterium sp. NIES-65]